MEPGIYNLIFIGITVLISIRAFSDDRLLNKLILWPRRMNEPNEYYRLITCGFVHNDWMHLFFNMFTLFFIGNSIEAIYRLEGKGFLYPVLYLSGILISSLPSFFKHRDTPSYRSLGASGGVAAVLFAGVAIMPWSQIMIYFIPMPSIVFAVLYLLYSMYMSRRSRDFINHDAHFWGAVYGFVFTLLVLPNGLQNFLFQIQHPNFFSQ